MKGGRAKLFHLLGWTYKCGQTALHDSWTLLCLHTHPHTCTHTHTCMHAHLPSFGLAAVTQPHDTPERGKAKQCFTSLVGPTIVDNSPPRLLNQQWYVVHIRYTAPHCLLTGFCHFKIHLWHFLSPSLLKDLLHSSHFIWLLECSWASWWSLAILKLSSPFL